MYLFTKKIKCLNCNGNLKGVTERGKQKYVCSTYSNHRTCVRHVVEENKLVYLAHKHIEVQQLKRGFGLVAEKKRGRVKVGETESDITLSQIQEYVNQVNIDPVNKTIEILYKDNTRTFVSDDGIFY